MHTRTAFLSVFVIFIIYHLLSKLIRFRQNAMKARKFECKPPTAIQKNRLPLGIDQIRRTLNADKDQLFLVDLIKRFRDVGAFTYQASILGSTSFFTADPENIKAILATQFSDFDLGPTRRGNFFPLLGDGIFTQDGKSWQHSRAMMRPQFAREQISDLDLEEQHVQNMLRVLSPTLGWTDEVDLQPLFFRLTLDSATEFLFGQSVGSQLADSENFTSKAGISADEKAFATSFDQGGAVLSMRLRLKDKYWLFSPSHFKEACNTCHRFVDHFVSLALSKNPADKASQPSDGKYVFLDAISAETRNPIELRSQLLHILLAGRDTTASTLSWLFYNLARDPVRYHKLRTIIVREFGTYDHPTNITFATLKACKYLQYCNNETLRLHPAVPLNTRQANKDTTLPHGGGIDGQSRIFVPKGTQCDYSVHVMHHRTDIWGEDVEQFSPERWEGRKVGWEFLPFNGGPRICIGQQFALTEVSYVAVRLVQKFDQIENLEADPLKRYNPGLTSCSGNGVSVRLHVA